MAAEAVAEDIAGMASSGGKWAAGLLKTGATGELGVGIGTGVIADRCFGRNVIGRAASKIATTKNL